MATKTAPKNTETPKKERKPRTVVSLPASIVSDDNVAWPGQTRNKANNPLRQQVTNDLNAMTLGSVRRYSISGKAEQSAFISLFRSVASNVHPNMGVRVVQEDDVVYVKLDERISRPRKNKEAAS